MESLEKQNNSNSENLSSFDREDIASMIRNVVVENEDKHLTTEDQVEHVLLRVSEHMKENNLTVMDNREEIQEFVLQMLSAKDGAHVEPTSFEVGDGGALERKE